MQKITTTILLAFLPMLAFSQKTWHAVQQDITFKIKNLGITVNGKFASVATELVFSPDKLPASKLKGTAEVKTIKTGINKRDEDLLEEKYFNADSFKTIQVVSEKLYTKGANYAGMFNVTIKGITKQIEMPFEFNQFADEATIKGSFQIDRRDFGIGGKSMTMADEVTIDIVIKAKS